MPDPKNKHCNRGKWSTDEEKKLIIAVHEVRNEKLGVGGGRIVVNLSENPDSGLNEDSLDDIPWPEVAALVQTRAATQCRKKWAETLKRSADSKKAAAAEKSTDLALLSNLNKVLTPEPMMTFHQPLVDVVVSSGLPTTTTTTTINLTRFEDEPSLIHQQLQQNQLFQTFQHQQILQQTYQHQQQQPQHIDLVLARPKHPQEELILFGLDGVEAVDEQTFSNLQLSYITPID